MINEPARVKAYKPGYALVELDRGPASACVSCKARAGCGQGLLATMGQSSLSHRIEVPATDPLVPGTSVTVSFSERQLLLSSLWTYGLPLIAVVAGAVIGAGLDDGGDLDSGLGVLLGLALAGTLMRFADSHWAERLGPFIGPKTQ